MSQDANVSSSTRDVAVPQNQDLVKNFINGGLTSQKRNIVTPEGYSMPSVVYDVNKRVRAEDALSTYDFSSKGPQHSTPGDILMDKDAKLWNRDKYNFRGTAIPQQIMATLQQMRGMAGDNGLLPPVNKGNMFSAAPPGQKVQSTDDLANKNNNSSSGSNVCVLNTIVLNPSNYRGHFLFGNAAMEYEFIKGQILLKQPHPNINGVTIGGAHVRSLSSINRILRQNLTMSYKNWKNLPIFNGNGPRPLYPSDHNGLGNMEDAINYCSTDEWQICGLTRDKYTGHNLLNVAYDGTYQDFPNVFLACQEVAMAAARLYVIYTLREEDNEPQQQLIEFFGQTYHIHDDATVYPRIELYVYNDGILPEFIYHTKHIRGNARQIGCVQYPTTNEKASNLALHAENLLYPTSYTMNKITDSLTKLPTIGIHAMVAY